jgi:hypothetical protein
MHAVEDEFRLTVDFDDEADGADLSERLSAFELSHGGHDRFGDRIVVSRDGACVYLYAAAEADARKAETIVRAELARRGREARLALDRWHPIEQAWEEVSVPLPASPAAQEAERERMLEREAAESEATGRAMWEVRVELAEHDETVELAERLEAEGLAVVRRHRFLLVGAEDREQAQELAERIKREAPGNARVAVEPGGEMVWEVQPHNPFAIFGGLGN